MPIPTELLAVIAERLTPDGAPPTAGEVVDVWNSLFARFDPLIGSMGMQLLFARTLRLQADAFPWLPHSKTPDEGRASFASFARALDGRQPDDIQAASHALLVTFSTLLAELIGDRLATRFLCSALTLDDTNKNS